jgi:hypothetical protein
MLVDVAEAAKESSRASAISTFVMRAAMLRECGFTTLDAMLIGTLAKQSFRVRPRDVSTHDPKALTAAEAEIIGRGFECILRLSATHIEAVDELLRKYPALTLIREEHVWFRPMLEAIAKRRMASAPLGLKLRLGIGAGFSVADMLSDILSIRIMLQTGQAMGAYGMIGLIGVSLTLQLFVTVVQHKHRGRYEVAWEVFVVLSLAKPGVDAMRVASGVEHVAGAPLDPFAEMMVGKILEIVFEAVLGAALQATIVLSGHWSGAAVISVGISCLSIGFATAMMALDLDTNPARRHDMPEFYGYIEDRAHKRVLVFIELFAVHTAHSMLRTLTIAMLARTNWQWLVAYMAADFCAYITYKTARGDLTYWIPGAYKRHSRLQHCAMHLPFLFFSRTHGRAQVSAFRSPCSVGFSRRSYWTALALCTSATHARGEAPTTASML